MEQELKADRHRPVVRVGDTVRRTPYPWAGSVHLLLQYLEQVGFDHAPRFLGIDDQGREVLSFVEGTCGGDGYTEGVERGAEIWAMVVPASGLRRFAQLLRDYHDAVSGFPAPPESPWATGQGPAGPGEVICHNDIGPWNVVWQDGQPAVIIDWDYAGPAPPLDDVAYALEWVVPFCSDEDCLKWRRFESPPHRRSRLEIFADAYGLTSVEGLVEAVIARQEAFLAREVDFAERGLQPSVDDVANGYLDIVRSRIDWTRQNRHLLEG